MRSVRLLFVGGYLSYRALFGWLNPYMYTMTLLIPSLTTLAFFVYLGRAAHVANDAYYVSGNALLAAASPSLFGMAAAIAGERGAGTLGLLVGSPARRPLIFFGRALPATANGFIVSAWTFVIAGLLFHVHVPASALAPIAATIIITAFSCVGIGLFNAALGLRWRETGVLGNLLLYVLLMFCGVNVPLSRLPGWLSTMAQGLPVTHGAKAVRALVGGASFSHVGNLLLAEIAVGACYAIVGVVALKVFEHEARARATLDFA
jgi:ABC-2 type transport system permease protein